LSSISTKQKIFFDLLGNDEWLRSGHGSESISSRSPKTKTVAFQWFKTQPGLPNPDESVMYESSSGDAFWMQERGPLAVHQGPPPQVDRTGSRSAQQAGSCHLSASAYGWRIGYFHSDPGNARVRLARQAIFGQKSQNFVENMPDDEPKAVVLRVSVSPMLYGYLGYLARHTTLGFKETDVAGFLLTERLQTMIAEKYHDKHAPPQDDQSATASPGSAEGV
jgi:hypothetical protein